jgi:hypothetical protein
MATSQTTYVSHLDKVVMCSRLSDGRDGADLSGKEISARRLFLSLIWVAEIAYFSILKNLTVPIALICNTIIVQHLNALQC